ncbi:MAG TPA: type II secretion system F family protein [Dehalococcoidia bacterium]|nr:type II secretion system F family protein [Dehalococcoidia bacterium]
MDPLIIAISVLAFASVFVFVALVFGRREGGSSKAFKSRLQAFRNDESQAGPDESESDAFKHRSYSDIPGLSAVFARMRGSEAAALQLERAGVPLRVGEFYMIRWIMGGLLFIVPLIFGFAMFNLFLSVVLGGAGYMAPLQWLNGKRKGRTSRINKQLVDMLGMVSNSLKSGYGLMQSFEFAGRQMNPPLGLEIRRMLREATLGLSAEDSLAAMGRRIDSKDLDMVLTAINIQRSVGGNLAEILDNVAYTMRERERIRGEISTLTAQQKMTGIVVGGLPIFMFIIFMIINPDYMGVLFQEAAGRIVLVAAILLEIAGYFVMQRIMAIEV